MTVEPDKSHDEETGALPPVTQPASVRRVARDGSALDRIDVLAEETPVALVYNGISHAVMMASPADLEDFALGFSLTEGIIDSKSEFTDCEIARAGEGIEARIEISSRAFFRLKEHRRAMQGRTGCGLCGVESLDQALRDLPKLNSELRVTSHAIHRALDALPALQGLNRITHSLHAAAFCTPDGEIIGVREDVGRHNAFDKLVGHCLRAGIDRSGGFALLTARCSYELVEKAALAGVPLLVTISAPTSLAVDRAQEAGLTLVALARADSVLVMSDPHGLFA